MNKNLLRIDCCIYREVVLVKDDEEDCDLASTPTLKNSLPSITFLYRLLAAAAAAGSFDIPAREVAGTCFTFYNTKLAKVY